MFGPKFERVAEILRREKSAGAEAALNRLKLEQRALENAELARDALDAKRTLYRNRVSAELITINSAQRDLPRFHEKSAAADELQRRIDDARREIAELNAEISRAEGSAAAASKAIANFRNRVDRMHAAIFELKNVENAKHPIPFVKPLNIAKNETIETLRKAVEDLLADRHEIASAPRPSIEALALVDAEVEALADRGRPSVAGLIDIDGSGEIEWPRSFGRAIGPEPSDVTTTSVEAMLAWLFKEQLKSALRAEVAAVADDQNALATPARLARQTEIDSRILEIERREEQLVGAALERGEEIVPRADADVRAILGLDDGVSLGKATLGRRPT